VGSLKEREMDKEVLLSLGLLSLRIGLGVIFMAHGMQKLFGFFDGSGLKAVATMLQGMGFVPPLFWACLLGLSEELGGIFILTGLFTRIGAGLIAIAMIVAIAKVHGAKGLFMAKGGFEYPLLIILACVCLILAGAGRFSVYNRF